MLGIIFEVILTSAEIIPTPQNVLNEFDSIAIPFGIRRYDGEKSKDFKFHAHRISTISFENAEQFNQTIGYEARVNSIPLILECTSTSDVILKSWISNDYKFNINVYKPNSYLTSTNTYDKQAYSYDLLNRRDYPFLEEICAHITQNIDGARCYLYPFDHTRYNHILPYHLSPTQSSFGYDSQSAENGTRFYLSNRFVIPDSLEVQAFEFPSTSKINQVKTKNDIASIGDYHVDYWTGEVTTGTDFRQYNIVFQYNFSRSVSEYITMPGVSSIGVSNEDLMIRYNSLHNPSSKIKYQKYYHNQSLVKESQMYSDIGLSNNYEVIFQDGTMNKFNKDKWN